MPLYLNFAIFNALALVNFGKLDRTRRLLNGRTRRDCRRQEPHRAFASTRRGHTDKVAATMHGLEQPCLRGPQRQPSLPADKPGQDAGSLANSTLVAGLRAAGRTRGGVRPPGNKAVSGNPDARVSVLRSPPEATCAGRAAAAGQQRWFPRRHIRDTSDYGLTVCGGVEAVHDLPGTGEAVAHRSV